MIVTRAAEADFRARMLQECLIAALPATWERRAAEWEAARPRRGDFHGQATRDELVDRDVRCRQLAESCRRHASLLRSTEPGLPGPEVLAVLLEAA